MLNELILLFQIIINYNVITLNNVIKKLENDLIN